MFFSLYETEILFKIYTTDHYNSGLVTDNSTIKLLIKFILFNKYYSDHVRLIIDTYSYISMTTSLTVSEILDFKMNNPVCIAELAYLRNSDSIKSKVNFVDSSGQNLFKSLCHSGHSSASDMTTANQLLK